MISKNYLKNSAIAFIFSLFSFLGIVIIYVFFAQSLDLNLPNIFKLQNIDYPLFFLILFLFLFLVSFLTGAFDLASYFIEKKKINNYLVRNFCFVFVFLMLPFYIFIHWYFTFIKLITFRRIQEGLTIKKVFFKFIFFIFILFILTPAWIIGFLSLNQITTNLVLKELGYAPVTEFVAGTGSMYPTFPKGDKRTPIDQFKQTVATPSFISYPSGLVILNKRFYGRSLMRGDIVSFTNQITLEITKKEYGVGAGFIKRIIGLPGDNIELRGGIVYLNQNPLKEPYTAKPQSTFAESFLQECKNIKVPNGNVFVMGDNRKASGDSREIGFVRISDIDHVLPIENQIGIWDKHWRDTSADFSEKSKITLNADEYLKLLNEKRITAQVKPLKLEPKLVESAKLRAQNIIEFNDFSFTATKSGLTMQKAMNEAGYSNIVYGEAPTQGYFEASELIDNQFQFLNTKDFLLDKDYQDFGIAEVEGTINDCPTNVIIQHFAGYIPPNYSKDLINSWENALSSLNDVANGWKDLKNNSQIYDKDKADIDRLIEIINERQTMISGIVDKMHSNQWLTNEQNNYTKTTDKTLGEEEVTLAKKINDLLK
jgi:signal peptidase I